MKKEYTEFSLRKALTIMGATVINNGTSSDKNHTYKTLQATFPDNSILVVWMDGRAKERKYPSILVSETAWSKERVDELHLILHRLAEHTNAPVFEPTPKESQFNFGKWLENA